MTVNPNRPLLKNPMAWLPTGIFLKKKNEDVYGFLAGYTEDEVHAIVIDLELRRQIIHHHDIGMRKISDVPDEIWEAYARVAPQLHAHGVVIRPGTSLMSLATDEHLNGMLVAPYGDSPNLQVEVYGQSSEIVTWDIGTTIVLSSNPGAPGVHEWLRERRHAHGFERPNFIP